MDSNAEAFFTAVASTEPSWDMLDDSIFNHPPPLVSTHEALSVCHAYWHKVYEAYDITPTPLDWTRFHTGRQHVESICRTTKHVSKVGAGVPQPGRLPSDLDLGELAQVCNYISNAWEPELLNYAKFAGNLSSLEHKSIRAKLTDSFNHFVNETLTYANPTNGISHGHLTKILYNLFTTRADWRVRHLDIPDTHTIRLNIFGI